MAVPMEDVMETPAFCCTGSCAAGTDDALRNFATATRDVWTRGTGTEVSTPSTAQSNSARVGRHKHERGDENLLKSITFRIQGSDQVQTG